MPRAGSGSGGGGGRQSGGHSMGGHSSGGHRVGSGSGGGGRPMGGGSFGGGGRPRPTPPPPQPHREPMMTPPPMYRRGRRGYGYGGGCLTSMLGGIVGLIAVVVIVIAFAFSCTAGAFGVTSNSKSDDSYTNSSTSNSSIVRSKITTSGAFDSDCVVDELGWFDNVKSAGRGLQSFYEKTGVQPYVVLKGYDSSLTSDSAKSDFANEYYDDEIGNEDSFLFMYFAEENQDEDVGYMCYVCGHNAESVMDMEAVSVFWDTIDQYWYSDLSTDEMFERVFSETGDTIMNSSSSSGATSGGSGSGAGTVVRNLLLFAVVIGLGIFVSKRIKKKEEDVSTSSGEKDNPNMLN